MIQKISTPVSVAVIFDHKARTVKPVTLLWESRTYKILKIGLHHWFKVGKTLFHVFSVATNTLFFRLVLNTESLSWTLEEISDEGPN